MGFQNLGEYKISRTLGQGAFSKVKLALHRSSECKLAIKIIDKHMMREMHMKKKEHAEKRRNQTIRRKSEAPIQIEQTADLDFGPIFLKELQNEVKMMLRLNHPNIIKIYEVIDTPKECFVVMDYAHGELTDLLATKVCLTEDEARIYFRQLVSAIDHCHLANVVHRDLKLENLLLGANGEILVSDFGLGRTFKNIDALSETFCGTPNYASYELVNGTPYVGTKADIWAMGVILYTLVAGKPPFQGNSISELYQNIKKLNYSNPRHFSKDTNGLRENVWVNHQFDTLPLRILPTIMGGQEIDLGKIVKAISTDQDQAIVYTFRNPLSTDPKTEHQRKASINQGKLPSIQVLQSQRRRSISVESDAIHHVCSSPGKIMCNSLNPVGETTEDADFKDLSQTTHPRSLSQNVDHDEKRSVYQLYSNKESSVLSQKYIGSTDVHSNRSRISITGDYLKHERSNSNISRMMQVGPSGDDSNQPSNEEINDWHLIHKPATKIRSMLHPLSRNLVSELNIPILFQEIHESLDKISKMYNGKITYKRHSTFYMFECNFVDKFPKYNVNFQIEACKVMLLRRNGISIKRISGNRAVYNEIREAFIKELQNK